jgi:2-amino-4-hydroxy-6-hydroxymethyldihydropteridine diphosphokinase
MIKYNVTAAITMQNAMHAVYLMLGSNLGDRLAFLVQAKFLLSSIAGTIAGESSIYETEPWGFVHENKFLNQVIVVQTLLEPLKLLEEIKKTETSLGRINSTIRTNITNSTNSTNNTKNVVRYAARCIDIDILFYDNLVMQTPGLIIPHPEIPNRRFVLEPLTELSPNLVHPVLEMTCVQLLAVCEDRGGVNIMTDD